MAGEPQRTRAPVWVWVLALVLVALLVWLVGQRVQERPHVEIGVTGGEELPATPAPTPTAATVEAGRGESQPAEPPEESSGSGGEEVTEPEVPTSPAPRR